MENRRKTIVINKKFQHHYALLFVASTVVLTNVLIIVAALFPSEQPLQLSLGMAVTIGAIEAALLVGVWFASLRITHHIAGPVYVFTRDLEAFAGGDHSVRITLRDGDMFQEEAVKINASLDRLEQALSQAQGGDKQ